MSSPPKRPPRRACAGNVAIFNPSDWLNPAGTALAGSTGSWLAASSRSGCCPGAARPGLRRHPRRSLLLATATPVHLHPIEARIQRIGQRRDKVDIYNMRYAGSVEDRVHDLLSQRLEHISTLFGQLPDILEDVWIDVALGEIEKARQTIDAVPRQHPFRLRYHNVRKVDWESCARVLDAEERKRLLTQGWLEERKAHVPSSKRS